MTALARAVGIVAIILVPLAGPLFAQGNLLRNADFQDDWLTLLPELKNHHWNYTSEVFNRRDYNPDGWQLQGNWEWRDADRPPGQRRLVLKPGSKITQAVNWITINDSRKLEGWPDAGGFPAATAVRSRKPLALVRDLTLRARVSARNLPAGVLELRVGFSGASPVDDPTATKRIETVAVPTEAGTYADRTVEVKLPAKQWLAKAEKDPAAAKEGAPLPMACFAELEFTTANTGEVELQELTLSAAPPGRYNLLPNGDFDRTENGRLLGWSKPEKYRYFPPGLYYIFNTWHNSNSDNRGFVRLDPLVAFVGTRSLQMIVPSGDEVCVRSDPVVLNQTEPRLIEVSAWVKTEQLAMLQIDAEDEQGRRLDGFNLIHKNPISIGTNDWRLIRQVFRPAAPIKSLRLKLCARGMNGYTLDDTGHQPQQNVCGSVWWDFVRLIEPESTDADLTARDVKEFPPARPATSALHLKRLDLGERLLGTNMLTAEIDNSGREGRYRLEWQYSSPQGKPTVVRSDLVRVAPGKPAVVQLPYTISEPCPAYTEYRGELRLLNERGELATGPRAANPLWFSTWTVPIDLELGALYLRPEQKQFVRMNLGLAAPEMAAIKEVRLEVQRRGTGQVLKTMTLPATPADIQRQRAKIPDGLRGDFRNLLLADLDVSSLPVQPFADPQRNWMIRATAIDGRGKEVCTMTSPPFCRLAHDGPQPAVGSVRINEHGQFLVNEKPWMPWGLTYGHNPVYDGPADSGKYHHLANLKLWSLYDRHGGNLADRSLWDANCLRFVEGGAPLKPERLAEMFKQGLYASTVFVPPPATGKAWPEELLRTIKAAPNVVAVSPGPEEAFGHFAPMSAAQVDEVKKNAQHLRQATGKPVMVGHGGYWTRLEFERVPFFDIFDPETEPLYPAPLHTDLQPLIAGQPKVVWLRPQMYESVPYERWRYHVYVELIRGARGWQVAHGPGDASTFRGLHAELRHLQPAIYSIEKPPAATLEPPLEQMTRRLGRKTYIIAASTHGMSFGNWRWAVTSKESEPSEHGRARETADPHIFRDESDGYHAAGEPRAQPLVPHGIQNLIHPRKWPAGTKLVTWVKLDEKSTPKNVVALVKADGRWTHAATWGGWDLDALRRDNGRSFWFLRTFYRHARGFLGWGDQAPPFAMAFLPAKATAMGELPSAGKWQKLELPLDKIGATEKLVDGVGFLHEGGQAWWAQTLLVGPDGKETPVFGDHEDRPSPADLARVKIRLPGLKAGTKVKVLFEDRDVVAADGQFADDFRGTDLYQRYGGERSGYGDSPVAVHVYEISD